MRRFTALAALTSALVLLTAVPALAQYPPEAPTVVLSDSTVAPGQTITVSGEGFLAGSDVTIEIVGVATLATATVDAEGAFAQDVTIPQDLAPGDYTLRVRGLDAAGEPVTIDVALTVVEAPDEAAAVPIRLPVTGASSLLLGGLALLMVITGGAALYAARRRNAQHQA